MILFSGHPDEYKNLKISPKYTDAQCVEFIKAMAWTPIQEQREMFQVVDQSDETLQVQLKHKGLQNIGNTCYMASCLQMLFYCQPFRCLLYSVNGGKPLI